MFNFKTFNNVQRITRVFFKITIQYDKLQFIFICNQITKNNPKQLVQDFLKTSGINF